MTPELISNLVDRHDDHLQLLKVDAVIVQGPHFKSCPIALAAKVRHEQSKLEYFQLLKMRPPVANELRDQLIDTLDKFNDMESE